MDDAYNAAIPVFRLLAVVAVLLVLARERHEQSDSMPWGVILFTAILLFASSALYVGAPLEWSASMINLTSTVILGAALVRLVRH
jgi:hypothetical protein